MDIANLDKLKAELEPGVQLVAVSKTYPATDISAAYAAGQRVFGESRPQEMKDKFAILPADIRWHMIGHLQTNKVKYIAPFVELIHSVDTPKLLQIIDSQAAKNKRVIDVLFEVRIATEQTKHGWEESELTAWLELGDWRNYTNVRIRGLMGIATYTDNQQQIRSEFSGLKSLFESYKPRFFDEHFDILSMGMTSDYKIAIECGSNMVRIGSMIFGERQ